MGHRSIFTRRCHPAATALAAAVTGGVLSLPLALPAAAAPPATPSATAPSGDTARSSATPSSTGATAPAAGGQGLLAQTVPQPAGGGAGDAANPTPQLQEVVVTGFRESLAKDIAAKRKAIGFTDSIYAEDIGKFPDANIAEAFNRVPGITIIRDNTGQGVDIAIRGLGPDFTEVLLNGAPIAVASTGPTDAQNTNQEVDLNMFPPELFSSLTVEKTSSPDMLEGGAAGTVNMRSVRPFDHPGRHVAFGAQGTSNQNAGPWGNHEYLIASDTFSSGLGVLVGGVITNNQVATPGFETIGWSPPTLTAAQCGDEPACNATKGSGFGIPATVPAGTGAGLVPGTPVNEAFLLANNPGASIQQINNGIVPRLGRPSYEYGAQKTYNGIVSLEYRPDAALHFYMDNMFGKEHNVLTREDMDWVVRANGNMIPLNEKFNTTSCAEGCTVTSGTFANSQFFLEYRPYFEDTQLWGTNPGLNWRANDWLSGDIQANYTKSTFHREVPSVLVATASNLTVNYTNDGGIPTIASDVNLDNPANFSWAGGRVNMQDERRETSTKGLRLDVTFGKGGALNLKTGLAYDDIWRHIEGYDNSQAWQNAVCGDNPSIFLNNPNGQPPCLGASTPTPGAGYPTYPALGQGYSAGMGPLVYQGSLIPESALGNYLSPGPAGFITVNWNQFKGASDYTAFHANEPAATGTNTGASGGYVRNTDTGLYVELTGNTKMILHRRLRYVAGVRWVRTLQYIGGPESLANPLNSGVPGTPPICPTGGSAKAAPQCDGSFYPNTIISPTLEHNYNDTLPSIELVYDIMPNFLARFAASKTMTRPNPASMLPGVSFSDPSAENGTVGNSALSPYISKNLDFGLEYYTGRQGYIALTLFRKKITGFTANANTTYPFSYLAQYGVNYGTLTPTQQAAIDARGGPSAATVVLTQQVNATGLLTVNGQEIDWTQPLDFLLGRFGLRGFGFSANYTHISQTGTGAAPAIATGVPPDTYNLTVYYERGPWSVRMAENYNAANVASGLDQSGVPLAAIYNSSYREWDLSSYVDIGKLLHWPMSLQVTADALNLFDAKQRAYFEFTDATFTEYNPGRELMIGFRTRF
jgi:TonB-dependent receptor